MFKPGSNRLLESLGRKSRSDVLLRCTLVDLPVQHSIFKAGGTPSHAYFMLSGFASEVVQVEDGEFVEIGLVGHEGVTGTYHLLSQSSSLSDCFIQMAGTAWAIPFSDLEHFFAHSVEVRTGLLKYVQHQMAYLSQTGACNRVHDTAPRFARWLLTVQDRTRTEEFALTQEFLAQMLGTRRSTVNIIARSFEKIGLIGHRRGRIQSLNRPGLLKVACACYQTTRPVFAGLYL
jgi:CRP-like cAMP-binding protein